MNYISTRSAGRAAVRVELTNAPGQQAVVDADDFAALVAQGYSRSWYVNRSGTGQTYVRLSSRKWLGNNETVARLIVGAGKGQVVKYRDGDPLNLRRRNLVLKRGRAKGKSLRNAEGGQQL
jgi:hypothetical protein